MHDFRYRNGVLRCEGIPLDRLARAHGTPLYVYSRATLLGHYRRLDRAFASVPHLICFSVKSNANIAVLRTLARAGAGFDIVSGGELERVRAAGGDPRRVVFAGVGKTGEEIALAIRAGILFFSVESAGELEAIAALAGRLGKTARVSIRVNPDVDAGTHRHVTTGRAENKFGMDLGSARAAYARAAAHPRLEPVGVQMHIGSQITETAPYVAAIRRIRPFVRDLAGAGIRPAYLDIGGGMGIVYREETPATAARFAAAVLPEVADLGMTIILEPGRFIAGNAGVLLTRVLYLKEGGGRRFVIVDAGMNDLIRPSLYGAFHSIVPVRRLRRRRIVADVVGPVCESADCFAACREIPAPRPGELLAVMGAGAYGFSMASNYNARRRPAEVLVSGARHALVRERERWADLMRGERIPAFLGGAPRKTARRPR
ncbi:MAG: diaminopimelate decarboxylase [bacterium]|nr:diaminopimelate decarboxylase [bacterium]